MTRETDILKQAPTLITDFSSKFIFTPGFEQTAIIIMNLYIANEGGCEGTVMHDTFFVFN